MKCLCLAHLLVRHLRSFSRNVIEKNGVAEDNIDKFISDLWDWDWDSVIVRPLVKVKTEFREISCDTTAQRIYVFPYKELEL